MEELFRAAGHEVVPFDSIADVYIVNTCTVTQVSDKKSRQILAQAHRRNPNALIAAVGCYAEVAKEQAAKLEGVSLILGTEGRSRIVEFTERALKEQFQPQLPAPFERHVFEELHAQHDSRTRATLKVQDGCNAFCSYCIIPYARGALRSRTIESTVRELKTLSQNGYREIVVTGIQLSAYGQDLPDHPELTDLIAAADGITGIERIRLGSLEPRVITERFLKAAKGSRTLCPQFHLSLQSGSDSVLKRMNRRYTTDEYRDAVRRIRESIADAAITTDIIAGFVGETEEEHLETMEFVREIGFSRIHVFPYSRRKGTKADSMDGHLTRSVKEARTRELIALGKQFEYRFIDEQIGKSYDLIMEDDGTGYTRNYIRVRCGAECGKTIHVKIVGRDGDVAIGAEE